MQYNIFIMKIYQSNMYDFYGFGILGWSGLIFID